MFRTGLFILLVTMLTACGSPMPRQVTPLSETFESSVELTRDWFYFLHAPGDPYNRFAFEPVSVQGVLYTANAKGQIFVIDVESGHLMAQWDIGESISYGLTTDGQHLYVSTNNAEFIAMDLAGNEVWRSKLTSRVLSKAAFTNQFVYAQSQDGYLVALDRKTGQQAWLFDSGNPKLTLFGDASPIIAGNQVVASFASGRIQAFDQATGEVVWSQELGQAKGRTDLKRINDSDASPVSVNQKFVFGHSLQDEILLISLENGRPVKKYNYGSSHSVIPFVDTLVIQLNDDSVVGLHPQTGDLLWENRDFLYRELSDAAIWQGYMAFGDKLGWLHLIDPKTGIAVSRIQVEHIGISGKPLSLGDRLIVQGESGRLKSYSMTQVEAN